MSVRISVYLICERVYYYKPTSLTSAVFTAHLTPTNFATLVEGTISFVVSGEHPFSYQLLVFSSLGMRLATFCFFLVVFFFIDLFRGFFLLRGWAYSLGLFFTLTTGFLGPCLDGAQKDLILFLPTPWLVGPLQVTTTATAAATAAVIRLRLLLRLGLGHDLSLPFALIIHISNTFWRGKS